jgi:hypothetical protein
MPELPNSRYLRRGTVRKYLGIDDAEFSKLVRAGVLATHYLQGRGRAFYRRDEVLTAEAEGKIFKSTKNQTSSP